MAILVVMSVRVLVHAYAPVPRCTSRQAVLAFAVPWITIEGGWVTVVTGRGLGRNYASCMARLAVMKQDLHVVAKFDTQKDAGAISVQLRQH